jgi:hypothetical protein
LRANTVSTVQEINPNATVTSLFQVSRLSSVEGKLTGFLEEFRIQKDLFENQTKEANESLKRKDQELPVHLERMERQTVLRIETLLVKKKILNL